MGDSPQGTDRAKPAALSLDGLCANMRKSRKTKAHIGRDDMASGLQLSRADLLEAYTRMRLIREFEDRVHDEFAAGNIPGFVHLYAGEEASGVGVCMHLTDRDSIASTHRGHGHCIAKGCDIDGMMHEIFGQIGRA